MGLSYYGDKISNNMSMTPEGYLICSNVKIGRTGAMEYLGQELPSAFKEPMGKICKVSRTPEELFSKATMDSFEGKSVTNTHPSNNLDVNTTQMTERGHIQNIRRDGDYLVGDLFVKDAGLISEIQNNLKREVSCGYDCSWHKVADGEYEQRDIIGNHVAVVPNGRAGSRVAIQDSEPEGLKNNKSKEQNTGGKIFMGKMSKKILTAIGFQHYAKDAEPEDIAKAMDAMNEKDEEEEKKTVKDAEPEKEPEKKEEVKDADETVPEWAKKLIADVASLKTAEKKEDKGADDAKTVMDAVEKELNGEEVKDEDPEKKEEAKDEDPIKENEEKGKVADAALVKWVQDMKPIIMAIPDEKVRLETAKKFASSVHDARTVNSNGYKNIIDTVASNKQSAMDSALQQKLTMTQAAEQSCNAWKAAGEKMKSGK
ncbi:DUF2213 domain-containing protein [Clostridium estertheticum]|uniref:DUF2213 domain-containing protein n=1 Tax=Clostridium estertheticum TaxID=238834 RepID=UPI001C7D85CA|nr:DUF2213 domain-containing protein [Clostridium estertheticum]MBX4266547.1 DUF2213 domain-containing protein [Clostridium estertheticum]WLC88113.1 DUF2213 domain-containing protein [Clostridium estertheticum]